mmetsp:Transcript_22198/g.77821  ORF Transcript_22198/g.77821 Transcript_22198/m.77821 type:complete len:819 (-) Transcript_22198:156-2612(-)
MAMMASRMSAGAMHNEVSLRRRVPRKYWAARRHFEVVLVGAKMKSEVHAERASPSPPPLLGFDAAAPAPARLPSRSPSPPLLASAPSPKRMKKQYVTAVLSEDRLFLVPVLERLPVIVIRLRDILKPETLSEAPAFVETSAMEHAQHVFLPWRNPADHPDEDPLGHDFVVFEEDTALIPHLHRAWLHQVVRETLNLSIKVAVDSPRTSVALMDDITDEFRRCSDADERAAMLFDLAEPLMYDRAMKRHFFMGTTDGLAAELLLDLERASAMEPTNPDTFSLEQLTYVQAILTTLHVVLFNSEVVRERRRLVTRVGSSQEDLVRDIVSYGNHHRLWKGDEGDSDSADDDSPDEGEAFLAAGGLEITADDRGASHARANGPKLPFPSEAPDFTHAAHAPSAAAAAFEAKKSPMAQSPHSVEKGLPPYLQGLPPDERAAYDKVLDLQVAVVVDLADMLGFEYVVHDLDTEPTFGDLGTDVACIRDPLVPRIVLRILRYVRELGAARRAKAGVKEFDHAGLRRTATSHQERAARRAAREEREATRVALEKQREARAARRGVKGKMTKVGESMRRFVSRPVLSGDEHDAGASRPKSPSSSSSGSDGDDVKTPPPPTRSSSRDAGSGRDSDTGDGDRGSRSVRFKDETSAERRNRRRAARRDLESGSDDGGSGSRSTRSGRSGSRRDDDGSDGSDGSGSGDRRRRRGDGATGGAGGGAGLPPRPVARHHRRASVTGLFTDPVFDSPAFVLRFFQYCRALRLLLDDTHGDNASVAGNLVSSDVSTFLLPVIKDMELYVDENRVLNRLAIADLRAAVRMLRDAESL